MNENLGQTIEQVKDLILKKEYKKSEALICTAMFQYPDSPIPHNLMGLLLESKNLHAEAMKHFRAAYALDPTYRPSSWNLECFSSFTMPHLYAFSESDCSVHSDQKSKSGEN